MYPPRRSRYILLVAAPVALAVAVGCQGSIPTIFGYQAGAGALYDPNVKTVYVPVFHNRAFQTTPYRGMEVDITQEVVRQLGAKTTFKVVSDPERADTELLGNVVDITKNRLNVNQQNTIREGEVVIVVDVLWRDLRDGKILSSPKRGRGPDVPPIPFDRNVPVPPQGVDPGNLAPVRIVATGRMLPELGETNASAQQRAVKQLATQIVSMMEKPW